MRVRFLGPDTDTDTDTDTDAYVASVERHAPEFEERTGLDLDIRIVPGDLYFSNDIRHLLEGDGAADVYMSGPVLIWDHLAAGFVRPLDDLVARSSDSWNVGDFVDRLIACNRWSGRFGDPLGEGPLLEIPVNCESYNLAYVPRILDAAGVDVPTTWAEYLDVATRIASAGGESRGFAQRGTAAWHTMYTGYAHSSGLAAGATSRTAPARSTPTMPSKSRASSSKRCTSPARPTSRQPAAQHAHSQRTRSTNPHDSDTVSSLGFPNRAGYLDSTVVPSANPGSSKGSRIQVIEVKGAEMPEPTVVLVHGAFADASGWNGVITRLEAKGVPVIAPANPLRGIAADSAYIAAVLSQIEGPVVAVGHSYGGAVITNAATDAENVVGLVYVAAFAPDEDETLGAVESESKDSVLNSALVPRQYPTANGVSATEFSIDPSKVRDTFAGDLDDEQVALIGATQRPVAEFAFSEPSGPPAWKDRPTWAVVATGDRAAGADVVRSMAERAGANITELNGSHVIMISQPEAVTDVIMDAVRASALVGA
jgi:pimeloyl-ACP methyl ester carboxylesterase